MTLELFDESSADPVTEVIGPASRVLRGFALALAPQLLADVEPIARQAPFRRMTTPGGFVMSVANTSCGELGWTSDRRGYRYLPADPLTKLAWPAMPPAWRLLARQAAQAAGFPAFSPDACLVNRYEPGARLSLHQDRDERDPGEPIVSVSLGLPAVFQFGGARRVERPVRVPLRHGDVVVWGGVDRMRFHGVLPLADGVHPLAGGCRINLTFRRAG